MSDHRTQLLIKCAGDVVDLVNCGADPTDAATKVARDNSLNSFEIDRITHKVNQALTLGHMQTADLERKADVFPLTNSTLVKNDLYGTGNQPSDSFERAKDQPDGLEARAVDKPVSKKAAEESYRETRNYTFQKPAQDSLALARELLGSCKVASQVPTRAPSSSKARIALEESKVAGVRARQELEVALNESISPFTYMGGPDWARVEKVAVALGVPDETIDLTFRIGQLGRWQARADLTKVAQVVRPDPQEQRLALSLQRVDRAIKLAAEATAEITACQESYRAAEQDVIRYINKQAADKQDQGGGLIQAGFSGGSDAAHGLLDDSMGLDEGEGVQDLVGGAFGQHPEGDKETPRPLYAKDIEQGERNINAQRLFQTAMQDPYIQGHGPAKVVDAINRAQQLNSRFSEPEVLSYIRQDLSTDGGVPLDLQLKATKSHGGDE